MHCNSFMACESIWIFFHMSLVRMLGWECQEHSFETFQTSSVMNTPSLYVWVLVSALTIVSHPKTVVKHCKFTVDILCCHKYYTECAFVFAVRGPRIWWFFFCWPSELKNSIFPQNYSTIFFGSLNETH
jgi:hypothetical protein